MGINGNFTLFKPSGGAAGESASDYIQDVFDDVSVPATNNTGLTDSSSTNPLTDYFNDTDAPAYGAKTLWIKDLILLEDHSKWINNQPTYQIIFTENYPNVSAYAYGNIRLRNYEFGKSIDIRNIDDGVGIVGILRRVQFILNPTDASTGTADIVVDGTDTTNDVDFGSLSGNAIARGYNHYSLFVHASSDETEDIHDIRLTANEYNTLNISGFLVYFENGGQDITLRPGSTYVNKAVQTTTAGSTQSLATISGNLGGRTAIYKTSINTYGSTSIVPPGLTTIAQGSSGTNTINVTTGHGSSFPIGTGFVTSGGAGTSYYVGSVLSVSTDTLTVSPTLPFGISGSLYNTWYSSSTGIIGSSLYQLAYTFDPGEASVTADTSNGFVQSPNNTGSYYFSDPDKRYRVWGASVLIQQLDGYYGIGSAGSNSFLQVDGNFQAAEIEFVAPASGGVLHGTFGINGTPGWGTNEGFTNVFKRTVFTNAGPAWNSFQFNFGASHTDIAFHKIHFYQLQMGATLGVLSLYDTIQDQVERTALNATYMQLGLKFRSYADELFLEGDWNRAATYTSAGGVCYFGNTTNLSITYEWYGKNFALIGTAGASGTLTVDGGSVGPTFNVMNSIATLGFHSLVYSHQSGTVIIEGIDVQDTHGEFISKQNYLPREELDDEPGVYQQADTPRNPKSGTIWAKNPNTGEIWIYLFDKWNKLSIEGQSDDPNVGIFILSHGTHTDNSDGNGTGSTYHYNFTSWLTATTDSTAKSQAANADGTYNGFKYSSGGINTSGTNISQVSRYDKTSWITISSLASTTRSGSHTAFNGKLYLSKGASSTTTPITELEEFNGTSWSVTGDYAAASCNAGSFNVQNQVNVIGGYTTVNTTSTNGHYSYDGSSFNTESAAPASSIQSASGGVTAGRGFFGQEGGTNTYVWNGSWSSAIACSYAPQSDPHTLNWGGGCAFASSVNKTYVGGGWNNTSALSNSSSFNGTSWSAEQALPAARCGPVGAVI